MDAFADLLTGVYARSAAFCQTILAPPWSLRIADGAALALATTVRGHAWIVPDEGEPILMKTGDVAIVQGPQHYTVSDDPATPPRIVVHRGNRLTTVDGTDITDDLRLGPRTSGASPHGSAIVASGTYQVGGDVSQRLLSALPHVLVVPEPDVRGTVMHLLADEVGRDEPGQDYVLDRLLDLALVTTLRAWFAQPGVRAPGWYRALGDPLVGPALRAMHADPARAWTVAALATHAGCSRATFARRFAELVGEPPMAYLADWRITLAADMLRDADATVEAVARRVGYSNAFALSTAFKRLRGVAPSAFRTAHMA